MNRAVEFKCIRQALKEHDDLPTTAGDDDVENLTAALDDCFSSVNSTQAVLGMDIYKYSRMPLRAQRMVPSLLEFIRDDTLAACHNSEGFIFHTSDFTGPFVSTGDGGFHVFATPLHALVFAVFFQSYVAAYNSGHYLPRLHRILDQELVVRYALTYGELFLQDRNVFGDAVITNARIMSRDSLNRCLLDQQTIRWFRDELVSIESLLTTEASDLERLGVLANSTVRADASRLFGSQRGKSGIRAIHVQDIGVVVAKSDQFHVYSLMIQVAVPKRSFERRDAGLVVVTIGNLNTVGISG